MIGVKLGLKMGKSTFSFIIRISVLDRLMVIFKYFSYCKTKTAMVHSTSKYKYTIYFHKNTFVVVYCRAFSYRLIRIKISFDV